MDHRTMMTTQCRAERIRRGLTLAQAAVLAGLDPADLSRIETGRTIPYPRHAARLARLLDLPADRLQEPASLGGVE